MKDLYQIKNSKFDEGYNVGLREAVHWMEQGADRADLVGHSFQYVYSVMLKELMK